MSTLARSLARLAARLTTLTATRLELLSLEALEARDRLLRHLGVLLLAAVFLLLALLVASLAVAAVFWPTEYRVLSLLLLALLYAVLGAGLLAWLRYRLDHDPEPFSATTEVLRADAQSFEQALGDLGRGAPRKDADATAVQDDAAGGLP